MQTNSDQTIEQQNGPSIEVMADADGLLVPEAYKPCLGTWGEFKTDVRTAVLSCRSMWEEKWDDTRERVSDVLARRKHTNGLS